MSERGKERGQSQVNVQPSFFLTIGARIGVLLGIIESPGVPNPTKASGVSNNNTQSKEQPNLFFQELFWAALKPSTANKGNPKCLVTSFIQLHSHFKLYAML